MILSASLSTIVGGKGNTIQALNDSESANPHPNTIIGANDSEITASQFDYTGIGPPKRVKGNIIVGGTLNKIHIGDDNAIVGGLGCEITSGTLATYNAIVGSQACKIMGGSDLCTSIGSLNSTIGTDTNAVSRGALIRLSRRCFSFT